MAGKDQRDVLCLDRPPDDATILQFTLDADDRPWDHPAAKLIQVIRHFTKDRQRGFCLRSKCAQRHRGSRPHAAVGIRQGAGQRRHR